MNVVQGSRGCGRIRPLLDSYVSGELLVETNHEILEHLAECTQCSQTLTGRVRAREVLRAAVTGIRAPEELRIRITNSLRGVATVPRQSPNNWTMLATIAAGLAVLVVSGAAYQAYVAAPARTSSVLKAGRSNHQLCALRHILDQPDAHDAMAKKLEDYRPLLAAVEGQMQGYNIRAGHRCVTEGRKFAHLVLQKGPVVLSVSVLRKDSGEGLGGSRWSSAASDLHSATLQNVEVAGFETADHLVFISSNQAREENLRVAMNLAGGIREALKDTASPGALGIRWYVAAFNPAD